MLFFALAFGTVIIAESLFKEEERLREFAKEDLFLSYENGNNFSEVVFVRDNSVFATSSSYFPDISIRGAKNINTERENIISYKVEKEDSLQSIAGDFGISVDTIKWANSIEGDKVNPGDELLILPVTGVLYYVEENDSPGRIAEKHKADLGAIMSFNNITNERAISPGDSLIIPGGEKPEPKPRPVQPPSVPSHRGFVAVTYGTITQGDHSGHRNAIDIANACGTPIYAASSGVVTGTGSNCSMAGRHIWIDHNGTEAMYAHLQSINVSLGQSVRAGEQIGTMGNTGYTIGATGCHLHFETRNGKNPFSHMGRGQVMQ